MTQETVQFWNPFRRRSILKKEGTRVCPTCGGRGERMVYGVNRMPQGMISCKTCKGKGKVPNFV